MTKPRSARTAAHQPQAEPPLELQNWTACSTRHLAAERAMRVIERFGWPLDVEMLEWLSATADAAGAAQNNARVVQPDFDVPF